ncbi:MAG: MBL fold metallo-hydrolase [Betaproteobacteria bacterium]
MGRGPRWALRAAGVVAVLTIAIGATLAGCQSFGAKADGERLARMQQSPEWRGDEFVNPQPMWNDMRDALLHALDGGPDVEPAAPVPVVPTDPALLAQAPASGLRVTWFGHSSTLIEIDGIRVLTDPIWSERASPVSWAGPRRWYPPTIALDKLPPIDLVVLSHDHYDHLDFATIAAMRSWKTIFVTPLGIGAHLARWGIPAERIVELDWWQSRRVGAVTITLTPARHASGRVQPRSDATLWGGFAFVGAKHRAYYSGDTGLFDAMTEIGQRLGPFDVALIEAGQYDADWPDWHLGPEQSVLGAQRIRAATLIPVHWGLFRLAHHGWTEPVERVLAAARCVPPSVLTVLTPRPGQSVQPTALQADDSTRWWPAAAWATAREKPIVATTDGEAAHRVALPACADAAAAQSASSR